jgi:hypothetical protein
VPEALRAAAQTPPPDSGSWSLWLPQAICICGAPLRPRSARAVQTSVLAFWPGDVHPGTRSRASSSWPLQLASATSGSSGGRDTGHVANHGEAPGRSALKTKASCGAGAVTSRHMRACHQRGRRWHAVSRAVGHTLEGSAVGGQRQRLSSREAYHLLPVYALENHSKLTMCAASHP